MSTLRIGASVAALLLAGAASAYAQTPGMICGRVTDPTGAGVPLVFVTLTGDASTPPVVVTTGSTGDYVLSSVAAGTHTLSFEHEGLKKYVRPNFIVTAGSALRVDQQIAVSEVSEPVSVIAAAPSATVAYDRPQVNTRVTTTTITTRTRSVPPHPCGAPR